MTASQAEDALENLVGETLANRYLIEHKLGEGAMGTVYRARHVKVGRPFAVKVLHPRLLEDRKTLQRFEREAELAGRLHHPNVIGVVDVGETHGLRYMVMDFAKGPDLAEMLGEAPMPAPRIIHLVRQLLEGLYHAHEQGLIHRDFKPENVIVEKDTHGAEVPRIVDFGIAILREGGDSPDSPGRLTTNGLVLGTPHYMAPEQAVADPVDHRIDLFALGIVVYELLCGKLPFDGNGAEVARANLLLDPPRIADRVPFLEVDPLLEAFARRLMAKKRDARPPTAKAARELLDLIDRDRGAAAAALGVPLAPRPPMTTLPSQAVDTPRDAPALEQPVAIAVPQPSPERYIDTEPVGRGAQPAKRKPWPLVGAAIAGAAVLGGGLFVAMSGGGAKDASKDRPQLPSVAAATDVQPVPQPPTMSTPPKPEPEPVKASEPPPPQQQQPPPPQQVQPQQPSPKKPPRATAKQSHANDTVKPPPVESKPADPVKTIAPKPAEPAEAPLDKPGLVKRYKAVGAELKAASATHADEVADLQAQFSLIDIADALSSPDKMAATGAKLARMHAALAKLH